jgi:phosphohistidine swiveling domain-containing protein
VIDPFESWDPLHAFSGPGEHWTRTNVGEAMPGVLTPLGWTFWGGNAERAFRGAIADMGVLTAAERAVPADPNTWTMRPFYGRVGWNVDFFALIGDRMPGTSAEKVALSLLGRVPETLASHPTRRFYGRVGASMARIVATSPREVRRVSAETDEWYRRTILRLPQMDLPEAKSALAEACEMFVRVLIAQGHMTFALITPLYEAVEALVRRGGVGEAAVLSGSGGAEAGMLRDMWQLSRDRLDIDEFLLRHGYHGPGEGEASSRSWREDPTPLTRILEGYRSYGEDESPAARDAAAHANYRQMVDDVVAAVPAWQRPGVRALLTAAGRFIPQRGVPKRGMLQSVDVCRGVARRMGALLAADGVLADPEDVFYLTTSELTGGALPTEVKDLVSRRRERRALYQTLVIPSEWRGMPVRSRAVDAEAQIRHSVEGQDSVNGIGVSPGVVEGVARVVLDADFGEVDDGEILVSPTTDPSWASIMFVSAALVVDIGGALSHAAVVARELGLPCVVNTRVGTSVIRTGDRIRVDGVAGTVEILERAAETVPS